MSVMTAFRQWYLLKYIDKYIIILGYMINILSI